MVVYGIVLMNRSNRLKNGPVSWNIVTLQQYCNLHAFILSVYYRNDAFIIINVAVQMHFCKINGKKVDTPLKVDKIKV